MMLGEQQAPFKIELRPEAAQRIPQQLPLEQLLADPKRQGHGERAQPAGREGQVGLEQALEFQKRLVVEDDVIDGLERHAFALQAVSDGVTRESGRRASRREKRSSWAAATISPSRTSAAALSW